MLPKILGADVELGNFIAGRERGDAGTGTGPEAARALLEEIEGVANRELGFNPQDWGRRYLSSNGGCAYIDLGHLEVCLPETRSAFDFLACWQSMLRIARTALDAANEKLPENERLHVLVNNSDGFSHSYGSHLSVLVQARTWDVIFFEKLHYLLFLASFHASSIVYAGQGKVGSENGRYGPFFQLSQRADFLETITGEQTVYRRPIINARDEPLGTTGKRFHDIFYDSNLCHVATVLKAGVLQLVLAMLEADWMSCDLILEDPLEAVARWSGDPTLEACASTLDGRSLTAVEHQLALLELAHAFVDEEPVCSSIETIVPRARDILALWESTILELEARDMATLESKLDWVLKLSILEQALEEHPELQWTSPEVKHLDQLYASLDPREGLFWCAEREGRTEILVPETEVRRFTEDPPSNTRALPRAMLLRAAGNFVDETDWHYIRIKHPDGTLWCIDLDDPADRGREVATALLQATSLESLLVALDARRESSSSSQPYLYMEDH